MSDIWESPLWEEIDKADDLIDEHAGDYGYGGEWISHPAVDKEALIRFIENRERRILGFTLNELEC